jgi:hypothetical protein
MSHAGIINISGGGGGGSPIEKITGNDGTPEAPIANNFNIVTANSTVKFLGSTGTETLDFGISNLVLGTSLPALAGGVQNVGMGKNVFLALTTGSENTSGGYDSALRLTTGSFNSIFGNAAAPELTTGSFNLIAGQSGGVNYTSSESSNICLASNGVTGESNVIRLGTQGSGDGQQNKCFIAGIAGNTVANQELVTINSATGQMGVASFVGSPVSFQAYLTSPQTNDAGDLTLDTTIIFNTAISNTGAAYNTTTGIFTAPATGFYCFSVVAYFQSLNTAVGASQILLAYTGSVQSLRIENAGIAVAQTGSVYIASASWGMPMTLGDTVQIQPFVDGTGTYQIEGTPLTSSPFGTSSTFSGFRVS